MTSYRAIMRNIVRYWETLVEETSAGTMRIMRGTVDETPNANVQFRKNLAVAKETLAFFERK